MKGIRKIAMLLSISSIAHAQRGIELTLKHSANSNRYEVYAKPNFSKRNFLLGPSQITLVLPSEVADEKLRISNVDGGTWEDNSVVYKPLANERNDYHGVATMGAKTDLVEGNETLLFSFSLPKNIKSSEVRLFDNNEDPNSSAPGMQGGDFSNTLNDAIAGDFYLGNYKETSKKTVNPKDKKKELLDFEDTGLVLYPNTTKDDFKVSLSEVSEEELVTLILSTETGRIIMEVKTSKKDLEEKILHVPSELPSQNLVVRVKTDKKLFGRKLILDRE